MNVARSVGDGLAEQITFEIERIDRMCSNVYVSSCNTLQGWSVSSIGSWGC